MGGAHQALAGKIVRNHATPHPKGRSVLAVTEALPAKEKTLCSSVKEILGERSLPEERTVGGGGRRRIRDPQLRGCLSKEKHGGEKKGN